MASLVRALSRRATLRSKTSSKCVSLAVVDSAALFWLAKKTQADFTRSKFSAKTNWSTKIKSSQSWVNVECSPCLTTRLWLSYTGHFKALASFSSSWISALEVNCSSIWCSSGDFLKNKLSFTCARSCLVSNTCMNMTSYFVTLSQKIFS